MNHVIVFVQSIGGPVNPSPVTIPDFFFFSLGWHCFCIDEDYGVRNTTSYLITDTRDYIYAQVIY